MKCSVYIATSADGYIATPDGSVDWLHSAGNQQADMGFQAYMISVDCMIMGRKCMEMIASFNLTPEQWPYGDMPIMVLSNTIKTPPENLRGKVEMYSGDINLLIGKLESDGYKSAYIDGGSTITSFINLQLINEMTITQAPMLLGEGLPLFGKINHPVTLQDAQSRVFANDFTQVKYKVNYS